MIGNIKVQPPNKNLINFCIKKKPHINSLLNVNKIPFFFSKFYTYCSYSY